MTKIQADQVVKKSISLSGVVSEWAAELATAKGFGTNFSAYIADLIRRDRERENDLQLARLASPAEGGSSNLNDAASQIIEAVGDEVRKKKRIARVTRNS